jgi:hypothetical protein
MERKPLILAYHKEEKASFRFFRVLIRPNNCHEQPPIKNLREKCKTFFDDNQNERRARLRSIVVS